MHTTKPALTEGIIFFFKFYIVTTIKMTPYYTVLLLYNFNNFKSNINLGSNKYLEC